VAVLASLGGGHSNTDLSPDKKETPHNKPSARPSPPPRGILGRDASRGVLALANAKVKVRPDSRAGRVMRLLLDVAEVDYQYSHKYPDLVPRDGTAARPEQVAAWAKRRGCEFRDHDIVELTRYMAIIGVREIGSEPFRLPALHIARGRWSEATGWTQDFDDDLDFWTELM